MSLSLQQSSKWTGSFPKNKVFPNPLIVSFHDCWRKGNFLVAKQDAPTYTLKFKAQFNTHYHSNMDAEGGIEHFTRGPERFLRPANLPSFTSAPRKTGAHWNSGALRLEVLPDFRPSFLSWGSILKGRRLEHVFMLCRASLLRWSLQRWSPDAPRVIWEGRACPERGRLQKGLPGTLKHATR